MKQKLTTSYINNLEGAEKPFEIYDTEVQGLLIRVQTSGVKTYYLRYRLETGKRKRMRLGMHGVLKPPTAREIAIKMLGEVAQGRDPAGSRQQKKSATDTLGGYISNVYSPWVETHQRIKLIATPTLWIIL